MTPLITIVTAGCSTATPTDDARNTQPLWSTLPRALSRHSRLVTSSPLVHLPRFLLLSPFLVISIRFANPTDESEIRKEIAKAKSASSGYSYGSGSGYSYGGGYGYSYGGYR